MKTTELNCKSLMIGDWVCITAQSRKGNIKFLSPNLLGVAMDLLRYDEVSPIPLNPEILEKNGFRHYEETNEYILLTDDLDSVVLTLNGLLAVIFHWNNIPIMCVHELQHVLRLCNLNELADNLKVEE